MVTSTRGEKQREIHSFLRDIVEGEACGSMGSNSTKAANLRTADFQHETSKVGAYLKMFPLSDRLGMKTTAKFSLFCVT